MHAVRMSLSTPSTVTIFVTQILHWLKIKKLIIPVESVLLSVSAHMISISK